VVRKSAGKLMSNTYRDLIAWQKAMNLAQDVYAITATFPVDERYGLISQMRRCAVSITSDIAEGHGRLTTRDWQHQRSFKLDANPAR
jgi:hypothetical protein